MAIKKDTLDQLLSGRDPKDVFSKDGLFDELKKALAERILNADVNGGAKTGHWGGAKVGQFYCGRRAQPRQSAPAEMVGVSQPERTGFQFAGFISPV